jgi:hypothetical protein
MICLPLSLQSQIVSNPDSLLYNRGIEAVLEKIRSETSYELAAMLDFQQARTCGTEGRGRLGGYLVRRKLNKSLFDGSLTVIWIALYRVNNGSWRYLNSGRS